MREKVQGADREYLLQVCWKAWTGEDAGNICTCSNSADKPRYNGETYSLPTWKQRDDFIRLGYQ